MLAPRTIRNHPTQTVTAMPSASVMPYLLPILVFAGFSLVYLKEQLGWNHAVGFALIALGAFFIFQKW